MSSDNYENPQVFSPEPVPNTPPPAPVLKSPLSLSVEALTVTDKERLTCWVEHESGISFQLCYISKADLMRLAQRNTRLVWDSKEKTRVPRLDTPEFVKSFARVAVRDWKGATFNTLSAFIVLDKKLVKPEDRDREIAFTYENLAACISSSAALDEFLQEATTNPRTFNAEKDNEEGN